jgi:60 kDa SS-A/Ro ribonucleoprotein
VHPWLTSFCVFLSCPGSAAKKVSRSAAPRVLFKARSKVERLIRSINTPQVMQKSKSVAVNAFVARSGPQSAVPQNVPLVPSQVPNHAGGFVWQIPARQQAMRFLILGSGDTCYQAGSCAASECCLAVLEMCSAEAGHTELLELIKSVSVHGRAPKQEPTLLALAAAIVHAPTPAAKSAALEAVAVCARIPTHLFALLGHVTSMSQAAHNSKGWGRGMRRTVGNWYTSKSGRDLAMQLTKYKNREGWTHQDVLRMVHVGPASLKDDGARLAMAFAIKGPEAYAAECEKQKEAPADPESVAAVVRLITGITAVAAEGVTGAEAARLIREHGLVREHLPTTLLDSVEVWKALLTSGHGMPMEAMVRNLSKMTEVGLLEDQECADWVVARLTKAETIRASRIHPMKLLIASRQYQQGRAHDNRAIFTMGFEPALVLKALRAAHDNEDAAIDMLLEGVVPEGSEQEPHHRKKTRSWFPVQRVVEALDEAFKLAFGNVEPTGKRMMLALDASGSMSTLVPGTTISCREASAAMALVTCATESACSVVAFGEQLTPVAMKGDMTVTQAVRVSDIDCGATDCALPMLHALKNGIAVDCFVVYTDSETYFGSVHPQVALQQYRAATGIQAKLVVVGMVSNTLTIADPSDQNTLNLAGFDTSTPEVVSLFTRGEL